MMRTEGHQKGDERRQSSVGGEERGDFVCVYVSMRVMCECVNNVDNIKTKTCTIVRTILMNDIFILW